MRLSVGSSSRTRTNPARSSKSFRRRMTARRNWLGKKAGDTFLLVNSPLKNRVGKITQILSKYTRRFQVTGGQMELKFPGQTVIWTLHLPQPEKLTVADIQPMLDMIKARSEVVAKLRDIYRTTAITLNMYGAKLGHGACEALFDLVTSEEDFVRCAQGTTDALLSAVATLETKRTVVLDARLRS